MKHPEHFSTEQLNRVKSHQLLTLNWSGIQPAQQPAPSRGALGRRPANLQQYFPDAAIYDLVISWARSYAFLPSNPWWIFAALETRWTLDFWFLSFWTHKSSGPRGQTLSWWLDLLSCSGLEEQLERAASILSAGSEAGWLESSKVSKKTCLGSSTRSSKLKRLTWNSSVSVNSPFPNKVCFHWKIPSQL